MFSYADGTVVVFDDELDVFFGDGVDGAGYFEDFGCYFNGFSRGIGDVF